MVDEKALEALSYGMFLLAGRQGVKDGGCIINTAMEVTVQPRRVLFTVNKDSYTCQLVRDTGVFSLSVLSEAAGMELYQRFGFSSGRDTDKFAGWEEWVERGSNQVLHLTRGSNAWLSGRVVSTMDLGTHLLFLADVEEARRTDQAPSATYAYYRAHVKPAPTPAPAADGKKRWVCKVCGYVYEGEALPADFICPWCKHPASDFEPMA